MKALVQAQGKHWQDQGSSDTVENEEDEQVDVGNKESKIHEQQESARRLTRQVQRSARFKDLVNLAKDLGF